MSIFAIYKTNYQHRSDGWQGRLSSLILHPPTICEAAVKNDCGVGWAMRDDGVVESLKRISEDKEKIESSSVMTVIFCSLVACKLKADAESLSYTKFLSPAGATDTTKDCEPTRRPPNAPILVRTLPLVVARSTCDPTMPRRAAMLLASDSQLSKAIITAVVVFHFHAASVIELQSCNLIACVIGRTEIAQPTTCLVGHVAGAHRLLTPYNYKRN
ncbi:unnamed protein product [Mesocestoides corti]|uniref:Uncharacterized protein n=1 Tax=Mesocestoides corti TaxID=53468 RepID=A0A0R3UG28_MESCO|nr:unnamed protein product [Mesocestoides corti]